MLLLKPDSRRNYGLIIIALLTFTLLSSALPKGVQGQSTKIVYVVICIDSEMWGGHVHYEGSASPHSTMDMRAYSRESPLNVAAVFDSSFRNSHKDSYGNAFKITWFAEMDYLMAQSNFVWGEGSPAGVSGYTAIRDILVNNWGKEIQTYGDSIEYHHHFMIYNGTWKRYDNGPDAGYPDYQMYALDHIIIDRNFYPSTWRSGWLIMPTALSNWLEQWIPFDYTPIKGTWYPWHPSGMARWQTASSGGIISQSGVNGAFARARDYGSAIYSFYCHDSTNMAKYIDSLQTYLVKAETAYPNVSFQYCTAREAMQRALGFTDFTPPTFTVTPSGGNYTITSNEPLWKNHPYVALKYTDGTYMHMEATLAGTNTWTVAPPRAHAPLETIGFAASDLHGNPGVLVIPYQAASIESCNRFGEKAGTFSPGETIYVNGSGYSPNTSYNLYIVEDLKTWTEGTQLQRVSGTALSVTSDPSGKIPPTVVWNSPLPGKYHIVIDVNNDGKYNSAFDVLDDIEVSPRYLVTPEYAFSIVPALAVYFVVFAVYRSVARDLKKARPSYRQINCGKRIIDSIIGRSATMIDFNVNVPRGHKLILGDMTYVSI